MNRFPALVAAALLIVCWRASADGLSNLTQPDQDDNPYCRALREFRLRLVLAEMTYFGTAKAFQEVVDKIRQRQIKAPFTGVVVGTHVSEGDIVEPGQPVITIRDVDNDWELKMTMEGDEPSEVTLISIGEGENFEPGSLLVVFEKKVLMAEYEVLRRSLKDATEAFWEWPRKTLPRLRFMCELPNLYSPGPWKALWGHGNKSPCLRSRGGRNVVVSGGTASDCLRR